MIDDPNAVELVRIFFPCQFDIGAVTDCSDYFITAEIAQGIFNEALRGTSPASSGPRCIELLRSDNSVFARVHNFTRSGAQIAPAQLSLVNRDGGTLLTIEKSALNDAVSLFSPGSPAYFRLRVALRFDQSNPFIKVIPTPDKLLQSSYDEIEYLDFRLNEARTLPDPIELDMRNEQISGIKTRLVAFLTAIPVQSEISVSNTPSHKMRLLEHDLWNTYMPGGIPKGMMVYHWKRSITPAGTAGAPVQPIISITDFTAFVKLATRRAGKKIWLAYLSIAFIFGVLGNLAANYAQKAIDRATEGPAKSPLGDDAPANTTEPGLGTADAGDATTNAIERVGNGR